MTKREKKNTGVTEDISLTEDDFLADTDFLRLSWGRKKFIIQI